MQFAIDRKGIKVGNGECWTLVDEAYQHSRVRRPTDDVYVWGDTLELGKDEIFPGDVIQTVPKEVGVGPQQHTSLVLEVLGEFKVPRD